MKIEEAMVYLLASSQHGMKTEQIARELELRGLVPRRSGKPLDGKVIAAIVFKQNRRLDDLLLNLPQDYVAELLLERGPRGRGLLRDSITHPYHGVTISLQS